MSYPAKKIKLEGSLLTDSRVTASTPPTSNVETIHTSALSSLQPGLPNATASVHAVQINRTVIPPLNNALQFFDLPPEILSAIIKKVLYNAKEGLDIRRLCKNLCNLTDLLVLPDLWKELTISPPEGPIDFTTIVKTISTHSTLENFRCLNRIVRKGVPGITATRCVPVSYFAFKALQNMANKILELHDEQGALFFKHKLYPQAAAAFQTILSLSLKSDFFKATIHCNLGHALFAQNMNTNALAEFQKCLDCPCENANISASAHLGLGHCFIKQDNHPHAIEAFLKGIAADPAHRQTKAMLYYSLGYTLQTQNNIDLARTAFRNAALLQFELFNENAMHRNYHAAFDHYTRGISIPHTDALLLAQFHLQAGHLSEHMGKKSDAIKYFQLGLNLLDITPDDDDAPTSDRDVLKARLHLSMGKALLNTSNIQNAEQIALTHFRQGLALAPQGNDALIAELYLRVGATLLLKAYAVKYTNDPIYYFRTALSLQHENNAIKAELHFRLGRTLWYKAILTESYDPTQAIAEFQKGLALPDISYSLQNELKEAKRETESQAWMTRRIRKPTI